MPAGRPLPCTHFTRRGSTFGSTAWQPQETTPRRNAQGVASSSRCTRVASEGQGQALAGRLTSMGEFGVHSNLPCSLPGRKRAGSRELKLGQVWAPR